jgi:hypothetical protein
MSVDYSSMSDRELKRYMLDHRQDNEAFYAYMDRRAARPAAETISPNDPDWDAKLSAAIERQIREGFIPMEVGDRNLNYDRYKGYAIAVERIPVLGGRWHYVAKPLKLDPEKPHPTWEHGRVEVYGEDINDAVSKCKAEIDKLLAQTGEGEQ